ncbi:hypothetical protein [Winogradskyella sp. MIT101101]|uniref:hypothetical protein n=1 Tax=Winogradskyella sp. MIT101101 TaxID=3098297 RepID=UPI00399B7A08
MGIFWDLLQQDELEKQQEQADSVEEGVDQLETELANTKALLKKNTNCLRNAFITRYRW